MTADNMTKELPCDNEGCDRTATKQLFAEKDGEQYVADLCQECFDGVTEKLLELAAGEGAPS